MKLEKLLKNLPVQEIHGSKSIEITGICSDSRKVSPGNLFIAKKGAKTDGNQYVLSAVNAGAVALVTDLYDPFLKGVVQIVTPSIRDLEGKLACAYYEHPSKGLHVVGVTGTKGKTTTTFLTRHILGSGLIGTIEYFVGNARYDATLTTPDVVMVHRLMKEMVLAGLTSAAVEVSSHALIQGRVDEVEFDVGVYTNLTEDHLDYHGTMDEYAKAKSLLFQNLSAEGVAVYNLDCPYHEKVVGKTKARLISYGVDKRADLWAHSLELSLEGTTFTIAYQGQERRVHSPLVGRHNISNGLAAVGAALASGATLDRAAGKVGTFPQVPGRLEKVENPLGLTIYVDFAHTGKSLETVLESIRTFARGRIITVFGCGGDRDPGRRVLMARAVENRSDISIVTSDNPRTEDPNEIIRQILSAFASRKNVLEECDRRKAIELAVNLARPEDVVLIAGRGHEKFQIVGQQTIPFDDREVAREACMQIC